MGSFDFLSGDEFKAGLEGDYDEMMRCLDAAAWKSVHVLAGSIVEAILIDYISATPLPSHKVIDPLTLDLGAAIKLCRDEGIVSERAAALSDVVRSYRNLIHPGRVIRLAETVDEDGARVAVALVDMIAKEVGRSRAATRGYTAEQALSKIEMDASAVAILSHLVKDLPPSEQERLLLAVAPTRYMEAIDEGAKPAVLLRISRLFRVTYDAAPKELQKKATLRYLKVLREETQDVVMAHETGFFQGGDVEHLTKSQASLVKDHLLDRLSADRSREVLEAASGISAYLTPTELTAVVDSIISEIVYGTSADKDRAARELLDNIYRYQSSEQDAHMVKRLDAWIDLLRERDRPADVTKVEALKAKYELPDLPF